MRLKSIVVGGNRLESGENFAPLGRIFFPHPGAIGIGLREYLLKGDRSPATLIEIETLFQRRAISNIAQGGVQFEGVV
jgi:hypothetical protein